MVVMFDRCVCCAVHRPLPVPPAYVNDMQKIYDSVPRTEDVFNLNRRELELTNEIGNGNFGCVLQGVYVADTAARTYQSQSSSSRRLTLPLLRFVYWSGMRLM